MLYIIKERGAHHALDFVGFWTAHCIWNKVKKNKNWQKKNEEHVKGVLEDAEERKWRKGRKRMRIERLQGKGRKRMDSRYAALGQFWPH